MGIPVLERSICGLTIKTGSLIIGYLSLAHAILSVIQVLTYAVVFAESPDIFYNFTHTDGEIDNLAIRREQAETAMTIVVSLIVVFCVIAILNLVIDILLVVGIHKKKPYFMLPWIIFSAIGCILVLSVLGFGAIALIITFVQAIFQANPRDFFILLAVMVFYTLITAFSLYCFTIVYSYYRTTKEQLATKRAMQYSKM